MADYIPFEIQAEIIKSLPFKSLIRFRSVSKPWKSLIDSFQVMVDYHFCRNQPEHLLVSYVNPKSIKYYSIVNDDTLPIGMNSLRVPSTSYLPGGPRIIGSSQGLLCFYKSGEAYLWNPFASLSVFVDVSNVQEHLSYKSVIGFGVCPHTNYPKLVKISYASNPLVPWKVEVFTLSSRVRRSISSNLPSKSFALSKSHVAIDGVIYWEAYDERSRYMIISFDLTSEEFREIDFPHNLAHAKMNLFIFKPTNSLAVVANHCKVCEVWIMEHGVPKSFTKLFSIKAPNNSFTRVLAFRKNGEPIMETKNKSNQSVKLQLYKPYSKHMINLGINRDSGSFSMTPPSRKHYFCIMYQILFNEVVIFKSSRSVTTSAYQACKAGQISYNCSSLKLCGVVTLCTGEELGYMAGLL